MRVLIATAEEARSDIDGLKSRLKAKGLTEPIGYLPRTGVINGECEEHLIDGLRTVDGVHSLMIDGRKFAIQD